MVRSFLVLAICSLFVGCGSGILQPSYVAFIDRTGQVKIRLKPREEARSFSEGMAGFSIDGKWGFIDTTGRIVVAPQFGAVGDFSEGLALATSAPEDRYWEADTLFGYIDTQGKYVIPPQFNWVSEFSEGLAAVCTGPCRGADVPRRLIGYIDHNGKYVIEPRFGDGYRFSEGLAPASLGAEIWAKKGFIDKGGKFVIEPRFVNANPFSHGLAATDAGFVNHAGEVVISKRSGGIGGDFAEELAAVWIDQRPAFVDTKGQVQITGDWRAVDSFSEGLAPACVAGCGPSERGPNWGYIDKSGKFVIKPQFPHRPGPFRNGLALVCIGCGD